MKSALIGLFLLCVTLVSVRPLLYSGFFPMHDDTQVGRVVVMGRAVRNGQFPVRWVTDLGYGYGYPLFNFYGPLPYYVGGALYAAGLSGLTATKLMFALGIIGAGLTMFLFVQYLFGNLAGLVAAVAYVYAPYHAVEIYVRGAVGEFWMFMFLPIIFLGLVMASKNFRFGGVVVGSMGLAGVILSHTIMGYITTLGLALGIGMYGLAVLLFGKGSMVTFRNYVLLLLFGLGLTMFFWLPAFFEMGFTSVAGQIGTTAFWGDHFVCLGQLWQSDWGFGGSVPGCIEGMSFKLGKVHLLLGALGGIALIVFSKRVSLKTRIIFRTVFFLFVCSIILMTPLSGWVWQIVPEASFIQYPWRMLVFSVFGLSVFAGASVVLVQKQWMRGIFVLIAVLGIVGVNGKLFEPQYGYTRDPAAFETDEELRFRVSKISDEYLPPSVTKPGAAGEIPKTTVKTPNNGSVETEIDTETYTKAMITVREQEMVTINRAHFPGWRYYIEGKEIEPALDHGLPTIVLPAGTYLFQSRFTDTPVRIVGNVVSLLSILYSIFLFSRHEKKAIT
ncbi:hypothetical protein A2875_04950 [Candidatus Gottesmanbacteria bacterium RIFCSPHIGHO2_01_FULL_46_14]|uniref:Membrane protein 6-pyruvoyl-tetrahydropterin synthase-related domain-containing protein n=2 Tax=Microgenomates group TaxID=1794810 RepID=A0A1F5ZQ92_9BACT|nr:MAG: hypothetical protein UU34_C0006G0032 [Candidatus Curtissbacteria bacterium GW2011_GWA1_41_11]OGG14676.1 MAG: hypothetical protein A2875_04950 [Candidatus Gottesmanbacteria bacterium RIFCSPHIGHO2_01_FULL_46_14]